MTSSRPEPDVGLQVERTVLAWQRTALMLILVAALAGRAVLPRLAPILLIGGAGLVLAVVGLLGAARVRHARATEIIEGREVSAAGGRLPAVATALAVCCGALSLSSWVVGYWGGAE